MGSIPGSARSPGGGHGNPFQYFCLENPVNRGTSWGSVHRVSKSRTQLKWLSSHILTIDKHLLSTRYSSKTLHELAAAAAKSLQSCLTLCDPIDGSPPGSSVPGILQARTLEWVAISFSNAWKWKVKVKSLSCARLLATPWTAAYQAPPSMGFSRQEYWSGVPYNYSQGNWSKQAKLLPPEVIQLVRGRSHIWIQIDWCRALELEEIRMVAENLT